MAYNVKPGDTIAKWTAEDAAPCSYGDMVKDSVEGDNPTLSFNAALPDQGDQRNFSGPGSSNSDPMPAMPGAKPAGSAPMNPGLRAPGNQYEGEKL